MAITLARKDVYALVQKIDTYLSRCIHEDFGEYPYIAEKANQAIRLFTCFGVQEFVDLPEGPKFLSSPEVTRLRQYVRRELKVTYSFYGCAAFDRLSILTRVREGEEYERIVQSLEKIEAKREARLQADPANFTEHAVVDLARGKTIVKLIPV